MSQWRNKRFLIYTPYLVVSLCNLVTVGDGNMKGFSIDIACDYLFLLNCLVLLKYWNNCSIVQMFNNFISLSVLSSTYTWYTKDHWEVFLTLNIQTGGWHRNWKFRYAIYVEDVKSSSPPPQTILSREKVRQLFGITWPKVDKLFSVYYVL